MGKHGGSIPSETGLQQIMRSYQPPLLEHLTWTEARDQLELRPVGLLPVGAIEAHGPHLPLNTDVIIANGMARRGGAMLYEAGIPSIILPAISYSVSFVGACFSGTTPVPIASFTSYLTGLLVSHAQQGYRAICVCNAHLEPAHVSAVHSAVNVANGSSDTPVVFPDKRDAQWAQNLGEEFQRGSRHAGQYETSIMMAESPESVRRSVLEELEPVWIDLPAALREGAENFAEAGAIHGYFGDPRAATPEFGNELLDHLGFMIRESVLGVLAGRS
jgi:creatinine amidohydrolase